MLIIVLVILLRILDFGLVFEGFFSSNIISSELFGLEKLQKYPQRVDEKKRRLPQQVSSGGRSFNEWVAEKCKIISVRE